MALFAGGRKRRGQRAKKAIVLCNDSLRGIDGPGLGLAALLASIYRLRQVQGAKSGDVHDLFYDPIAVPPPIVDQAVSSIEGEARSAERRQRRAADPVLQGLLGLEIAAMSVWRNTWAGCQYAEVRYLARQTWGFVARGFDYVEEVTPILEQSNLATADEIQKATCSSEGTADYLTFPSGFEPEQRGVGTKEQPCV